MASPGVGCHTIATSVAREALCHVEENVMNQQRLAQRAPFADHVSRPARRSAGRTPVDTTPLNVRCSGLDLDAAMKAQVRERLGRKLGKFALHIERITVRFEDVNGPRGGEDTVIRIKVVLSGLDSVVYEARATDAGQALDLAADGVERAVRRSLRLARARQPGALAAARRATARPAAARAPARSASRSPRPNAPPDGGSLIGRRVGQGAPNLERALERPEKQRRDTPVDTALPGVSATDRKAGGGSTARRNTKRNPARATVALEDSARDRPSRKSTRKSANRARSDGKLARREVRELKAPSARAARANAQKR
jgi:ribosome-associated translation inhibitor RaiA